MSEDPTGYDSSLMAKFLNNTDNFAVKLQYVVLLPAVLSVFCIMSNGLLIAATVCSRQLRSSCNYLIAFDSMLGIISSIGHIIPVFTVFNHEWLQSTTCFALIFLPIIANETSSLMIVTIGADRLLHVICPIWVNVRNQVATAAVMVLLTVLSSSYVFYTLIYALTTNSNSPLMCSYSDVLLGLSLWQYINFKTCFSIPVCLILYYAIWFRFKFTKYFGEVNQQSDEIRQRLSKSLSVYMFVSIFAWASTPVFGTFVLPLLSLNSTNAFFVQYDVGSVLVQTYGVMPFLLYWMSSVYKKAFQDLWKKVKRFPPSSLSSPYSHHQIQPISQSKLTDKNIPQQQVREAWTSERTKN